MVKEKSNLPQWLENLFGQRSVRALAARNVPCVVTYVVPGWSPEQSQQPPAPLGPAAQAGGLDQQHYGT